MALQEQPFTFQIPNFLAGLHTCPDYRNRPINSLTKAKNAIIDDCGFISRRVGMAMFGGQDPQGATLAKVNDLISPSGQKLYAIREHNNDYRIAYCDGAAGTWTEPAHPTIVISVAYGVGMVSKAELVTHSDGTTHIYWGLNTTFTKLATATDVVSEIDPDTNDDPPPESTDIITFKDRLFYLSEDSKIHFSKVSDPETHERLLDVINVAPSTEKAVSIVPWKDDAIVVFTNTSIYLLSVGVSPNLLDWSFDLVTDSIGAMTNACIASAYDDIYFMDNHGEIRSLKRTISSLQAGVDPVAISSTIRKDVSPQYSLVTLHERISMTFYDGRLYLSILNYDSGGDSGNAVYVYDILRRSWTGPLTYYSTDTADDFGGPLLTRVKAISHVPTSGQAPYDTEQLYIAGYITDATDGSATRYCRENYTAGAGTNYARSYTYTDDLETQTRTVRFEIITRPQDLGYPHQDKTLKWVEIEYGDENNAFSANGSFTFYAKRIEDAAWTEIGTESYTTSDTFKKVKFQGLEDLERGDVFQFRIVDDSASDGPKIRGMWIHGYGETVQDQR